MQHLFTLPFLEVTESCTNLHKSWLSSVLILCFLSCPPFQLEYVSPSNTLDLFSNCQYLHCLLTILNQSQPSVRPHLIFSDLTSFLCLLISVFLMDFLSLGFTVSWWYSFLCSPLTLPSQQCFNQLSFSLLVPHCRT